MDAVLVQGVGLARADAVQCLDGQGASRSAAWLEGTARTPPGS
ncbi:hypothetical protein AB0D65_15900 [Streptomyces griseoloalbus]|uniref:Uncharacterized protein n=1 Tax=Streptomyces griseoloalbus TaxID=67303 RepID=A0ABV3E5L7_9ACTN